MRRDQNDEKQVFYLWVLGGRGVERFKQDEQ